LKRNQKPQISDLFKCQEPTCYTCNNCGCCSTVTGMPQFPATFITTLIICDTMIESVVMGLSKWLASSLFGDLVYKKAKKAFGKDKFLSLTEKALNEILKKEENKIIWGKITEIDDFKIRDPTEYDFSQIYSFFSGEDLELCQNFFRELEEEYLNQVYERGKEDPVTLFLMKEMRQLKDLESRAEKLLAERLKDVKKVIEMKKVDIKDFVGRKDIIKNFPSGDVFIHGKAAFGKTYVMLMLCKLCNGYYIPLDAVKEKEIFELLVREARGKNKRIFVDDFHCATQEIQEYIQAYLWNVVLASREECTIRRDFTCYTLGLLNKEDIKEYFSVYNIAIEEDVLKRLEDDLSFPIKLKIFVNYLQSKGIIHLDEHNFEVILEDLELKFRLPDELNEFYKKFVFGLFDEKQIHLCYVLSLLRSPASVGRLSEISHFPEGEVSKLLEKMLGVVEVYEKRYTIFHESFREFCLQDLGDARELHKKIGNYFEGLVETESDLEARIEGMYHLRVAGLDDEFRRVFDLSVVQLLVHVGLWDEAEENLEFGLKIFVDEKMRADTMIVLGTVYHRKGNWEKAMAFYKECQKIYEKTGDIHGMTSTYNNLGLVYYRKGEWDKAVEYYEKSLEIKEEIGDIHGMAQTYGNLGSVYADKGEWDKAVEYYEKDLGIFEEIGDVHGMAQTYGNLGLVYYRKGEWDRAIEYYEKDLGIFEEIGDVHGMAQTYNNLGLVYYRKGEWDRAIEYYEKDLGIFEEIGDVHGMAQTYGNLGLAYADKGEWDRAIEYYEKSLEISEEIGDIHGMAQTYNNLGLVYTNKGEWDKAIEYYEKSLEIKKEIGDIHGMAQTYNNLGLVYTDKGEWDKAIEYYEKSLEIKKEIGDIHGMAQTYGNLGSVYYKKGEWNKAIEYYEKDLEIFENLGDVYGMALTKYGIANILRLEKQFNDALKLYQESEKILKKLGDPLNLMNVYYNLAVCYNDMDQEEKATEYYQKAEKLRKQLGIEK